MEIKKGYLYFIKDLYFEKVNDKELLQNKENGNKRPAYYCFKDNRENQIIWFIPISSKVDKYKRIYNLKLEKQKKKNSNKTPSVDTLVFGKVARDERAFLIQNMFPVIDKYINNIYLRNEHPVIINNKTKKELNEKAEKVLNLVERGFKGLVFPDISKIKEIMKKELLKELEINEIFNKGDRTFIEEFNEIINTAISKEDIILYLNLIEDKKIIKEFNKILNSTDDLKYLKRKILEYISIIQHKEKLNENIEDGET